VTKDKYSFNPIADHGLKLSFAIKKKGQNQLESFDTYKNLFKPTLYHVDMNGQIKSYTNIPLKYCNYDD
jgi:hypothetical protein